MSRRLWRGIVLSAAAALLQALVAVAIVLFGALILHATAFGMTRRLTTMWRSPPSRPSRSSASPSPGARRCRSRRGLARDGSGASAEPAHHHHAHDHAHAGHDHAHHGHEHHGHEDCAHHVPLEIVEAQAFAGATPLASDPGCGLQRPAPGAILILRLRALARVGMIAGVSRPCSPWRQGVAITVSALALLSVFCQALRAAAWRRGEQQFVLAGAAIELMAAAFVATLGFPGR